MSLWIMIGSSFLLASFWNKKHRACQMLYCKWAVHCCCTRLFLIVGFHTTICWNVIWSDHHNQVINKTQFMFYKNDGEDNLNMWCVCAQVIWWWEYSLSPFANAHVWICEKLAHEIIWHLGVIARWSHVHNFFPCGISHHPQGELHCLRSIFYNSPKMYNFMEMHSCDIIQLFEFDLYKFNEFYPWPILLSKFLIVLIESHSCNSTHPHDRSHLDGQFDLWT